MVPETMGLIDDTLKKMRKISHQAITRHSWMYNGFAARQHMKKYGSTIEQLL